MVGVELDLILALHAGFIAFVVFGALIALRWPRLVGLHLAALASGIYVEITAGACPLTGIEWSLRDRLMHASPHRDFVDRYLTPLIYPAGLTPSMQLVLGAALVVWSGCVYGWLFQRARRARKKTAQPNAD